MTARRIAILSLITLAVLVLLVTTTRVARPPTATPCSEAWYAYLEEEYDAPSDDGEGHGPDYGDSSWFYSIERQIGLPEADGIEKVQRCQVIQQQLQRRTILISRLFGAITVRR